MYRKKHSIHLLMANQIDRHLLAQFLEGLGYLIWETTALPIKNTIPFNMIIADEIHARKFSDDLVYMKQKSEPVFLPLVICLLPKARGDHWLELGFDEILHFPTTKLELMALVRNLFRLHDQTETQFKLIYENIPLGIYRFNDRFQVTQANPAFLEILGFQSLEQILNKNLFELGIIFEQNRDDIFKKIHNDRQVQVHESIWITPDKRTLYIREKLNFYRYEAEDTFYFVGTIEDITGQWQMQKELAASEEKFRQLVDLSPYGILIECEGKIVFLNKAMLNIFRADSFSSVLGRSLLDYIPKELQKIAKQQFLFVKEKQECTEIFEEKILDNKGNCINIEVLVSPFIFNGKPSMQVIMTDISERERARSKIVHLAYHDQLTGLANRLKLEEELTKAISLAEKQQNHIAVIFIDIDNFKKINDTFGHDIGDLLLQKVAIRLQKNVRNADIVARLGGDEFVIILNNLADPFIIASRIVKNIMQTIIEPIFINERKFHITLSLGVSIYPENGATSFTLFKNADIAMYSAKQSGRNTYKFCTSELEAELYEKNCLELELYDAMAKDELLLYYQPKICLKTNKITGVEVLMRWAHSTKGLIPPMQFIPLAEATGLIVPMTNMILHQVCKQIKIWQSLNLPVFTVAINLSVRSFQEANFIQTLSTILNEHAIDKSLIEFEITESLIMKNIEQGSNLLAELKTLGVQISIDDFGTGYSSLNYLKQLAFDSLKIDKTFIRDISCDKNAATIVTAVIEMAHTMNMTVIAEGVESEEQFNFLKEKGCEQIQGFYICEPLPENKLRLFISNYYKKNSIEN